MAFNDCVLGLVGNLPLGAGCLAYLGWCTMFDIFDFKRVVVVFIECLRGWFV